MRPDRALHHALPHEGGGAGSPVRHAAHIVGSTRRPADDLEASRQRDRIRHRRRPAQNRQDGFGRAGHHGDLIHDPARRTDHVVLRLLAQRRQANGLDVPCAEGSGRRHLEGRARGHSHRYREVRGDLEPGARDLDQPVAHQHHGHTDDVLRPARARGQLPAKCSKGEAGQAFEIARGKGDRADDQRVGGMGDDLGALACRHFEHECSRIVRYPTEEVETPGRATPHAVRPPLPLSTGPIRAASAPLRVADPGDRGHVVQRHGQRIAPGIGDDATRFFEHQGRADVVGMAGQTIVRDERAQVGDETIPARDQLVELPAGREVLVVEDLGLTQPPEQLGLERGQGGLAGEEELRQTAEAVTEVRRHGRSGVQRVSPAAGKVDALSPQPTAAGGAQLIGCSLLGRREFGHGRRDDVRQTAARRRRRGQAPGRPLVVHQPSRAVDGVDDHRPGVASLRPGRARRAPLRRPRRHANAPRTTAGARRPPPGRRRRSCRPPSPPSPQPCPCPGSRRRSRARARRARTGAGGRPQARAARSSSAFWSGSDSLVMEPPPTSGPARYLRRPGARSGGCSSRWNG